MRIYLSDGREILILDSVDGLNNAEKSLEDFLNSSNAIFFIQADVSGAPPPYKKILKGIEFVKADGPVHVSLERDIVQVRGSLANLEIYCRYFRFRPDAVAGQHHHPEYHEGKNYITQNAIPVIIEVQDKGE